MTRTGEWLAESENFKSTVVTFGSCDYIVVI